jgi:hypothetical protein
MASTKKTAPPQKRPATTPRPGSSRARARSEGTGDEPTHQQISEAAYHRYLSRGGRDGADFDDWLEAERELRTRAGRKRES